MLNSSVSVLFLKRSLSAHWLQVKLFLSLLIWTANCMQFLSENRLHGCQFFGRFGLCSDVLYPNPNRISVFCTSLLHRMLCDNRTYKCELVSAVSASLVIVGVQHFIFFCLGHRRWYTACWRFIITTIIIISIIIIIIILLLLLLLLLVPKKISADGKILCECAHPLCGVWAN